MTLTAPAPIQVGTDQVDSLAVQYQLFLVLPGQSQVLPQLLPLEPFRSPLVLEDNPGELAQKLSVTITNAETPYGWLHQLVGLNAALLCFASLDGGITWTECLRGTVFDWDYDPLASIDFTIVAYDRLITIQQSKFEAQWNPAQDGSTFSSIVAQLCGIWGVPLGQNPLPGTSVPPPLMTWQGSLGQFLTALLGQVAVQTGHAYLLRATGESIDIVLPGTNQPVYVFNPANVESARDHESILDLVTEIQSTGFNQDGSRTPLTSVLENPNFPPSTWGHLREIVQSSGAPGDFLVQAAANRILAERGQPKRLRPVKSQVDIPTLRKGDVVYLDNCGTMHGLYGVVGVSHDEGAKTMMLTINFAGSVDYIIQRLDPSVAPGASIPSTSGTAPQAPGQSLVSTMLDWIRQNLFGKQWVLGGGHYGSWAGGVDCSGLVDSALQAVGITVTDGQGTDGMLINSDLQTIDQSQVQPGDLVFFGKISTQFGPLGHVGVVAEDTSQMLNALSPDAFGPGNGVGQSSIAQAAAYQARGILGYRRVPGLQFPSVSGSGLPASGPPQGA